MKNKYISGQSLFEVVVSIAISALIVTAIVALAVNSIQNSSFSRDKTIATSYVQETMEWIKVERDQNLAVFRTKATFMPDSDVKYCLSSLSWPATPSSCSQSQVITNTKFSREVIFPACSGTCNAGVVEVMINVYWRDSKGLRQVSSSTELSI